MLRLTIAFLVTAIVVVILGWIGIAASLAR